MWRGWTRRGRTVGTRQLHGLLLLYGGGAGRSAHSSTSCGLPHRAHYTLQSSSWFGFRHRAQSPNLVACTDLATASGYRLHLLVGCISLFSSSGPNRHGERGLDRFKNSAHGCSSPKCDSTDGGRRHPVDVARTVRQQRCPGALCIPSPRGELQNDVGYGIPLLRSRGKNRGRGEANYGIPANMRI